MLLGVWFSARRRDRRATQALRSHEERFRHLTSLSADWFWETDARAPRQLALGRPGGGGLLRRADGARPAPLGGARRRRSSRARWSSTSSGWRARRAAAVLRLRDLAQRQRGERRDAHASPASRATTPSGRFLGYRGVGHDITEQRRAERACSQAKERLELALDGGNLAEWDFDADERRALGRRRLGALPLKRAAPGLGLELVFFNASTAAEIDAALAAIAAQRVDALFIAPDGFFSSRGSQFVMLTARDRIPTSIFASDVVKAGLLMSYGTSLGDVFRQVGVYTGSILKGVKPTDLPVLQSTKFEFIINLQTARSLGLDIPPTLLARADEVIE